LKFGQRWPEDEMQDAHGICLQLLTVDIFFDPEAAQQ
jgi:hypothetical protein